MTTELNKNASTSVTGVKGDLCGLLFPTKTTRKHLRKGRGTHYQSKQRESIESMIRGLMGL